MINLQFGSSIDPATGIGKQIIESSRCLLSYIEAAGESELPYIEELDLRVTIKGVSAYCSCFQVEFGGGDPLTLYCAWSAKLGKVTICTDTQAIYPMTPHAFFNAIFKAREAACAGA